MENLDFISDFYENGVFQDFYKLLEVSKSASIEDIKKNYRRLAKMYHPDSPTSNEELMKKLSKAYTILKNDSSRKIYDEYYLKENNVSPKQESKSNKCNFNNKQYYSEQNSSFKEEKTSNINHFDSNGNKENKYKNSYTNSSFDNNTFSNNNSSNRSKTSNINNDLNSFNKSVNYKNDIYSEHLNNKHIKNNNSNLLELLELRNRLLYLNLLFDMQYMVQRNWLLQKRISNLSISPIAVTTPKFSWNYHSPMIRVVYAREPVYFYSYKIAC